MAAHRPLATTIEDRVAHVTGRITDAARAAGRDPQAITLVAVTKTWPVEVLAAAYTAGLRHFGENRTHELAAKRPAFEQQLPPNGDLIWHFIGHCQSRQSLAVATHADVFHAADRLKIIRRLGQQAAEQERTLDVLLEVNISGEASKAGFSVSDWERDAAQATAVVTACRAVNEFPALRLTGLMTMAPWHAPEATIRTVFTRTRQLRDWLATELGQPLPQLSMGMTDDFELAIAAGATHIRVGRALFGERH